MATSYRCKTPNCTGTITFPDKSDQSPSSGPIDLRRLADTSLSVIESPPVRCEVCGNSYFEKEVQK